MSRTSFASGPRSRFTKVKARYASAESDSPWRMRLRLFAVSKLALPRVLRACKTAARLS